MKLFIPNKVIFHNEALEYEMGKRIFEYFKDKQTTVIKTNSRSIMSFIEGVTEREKYFNAKKTLLVTVKKGNKLIECKPSADFEFSVTLNCPGNCEYCYLQAKKAHKPYLKVYVNTEYIFKTIKSYINSSDKPLTFEAASLGDPLSLEHITGSMAKTIEFFGSINNAGLRVVTKYDNVDSLLNLKHNGNTRFRISVNSEHVIKTFEHYTSNIDERIEAAYKLAKSGYPIGFIVAPIMIYDGWEDEYRLLFEKLKDKIGAVNLVEPLTFELIQHRFTENSRKFIQNMFPKTKLDMSEERRRLKWSKFGLTKFLYNKELTEQISRYLKELVTNNFPNANIEYFV